MKKLLYGIITLLLLTTTTYAQNTLDKMGLTSSNYASAAYSFRLLSTAYTGPLARITIGTNYYDVYPDTTTGEFSLTSKISIAVTTYNAAISAATVNSLNSIVTSSTSATVAILYDQSGNSKHAVQAGTGAQPRIINAGTIDANNGKAAMTFLSAGQELVCSSTITVQTINAVRAVPNLFWQTLVAVAANTDFSVRAANGSVYNTSPNANDWTFGTSPNQLWVNGTHNPLFSSTIVHTAVISANNPVSNTMSISTTFLGRGMYGGATVNELVLFPSTLSTVVRQTLESNQTSTFAVFLITGQPSTNNQSVSLGGAATTLSVTSGMANSTYQWYSNTANSNSGGTALPGDTNSSFTPPSATEGTLYYYAVVSNTNVSAPTKVSGYVRVGIEITSQPSTANQNIVQDSAATALTVIATGSGLSYQWYQHTTSSNSGGTLIPGATSSSYTPSTSTLGFTYYYATVTGLNTLLTSNVSGPITIVPRPPIISYNAAAKLYTVGTSISPLNLTHTGGSVANNLVTTFASNINRPIGIAFSSTGNLFVATQYSDVIKIIPSGTKSTFASGFDELGGIAVDTSGNVFVSNIWYGEINKITPLGSVSTFTYSLYWPTGLATDKRGNVYAADQDMGDIKKITPGGSVSTLAYGFYDQAYLAVDSTGNVFVSSMYSGQIKKITPGGSVSTVISGLSSTSGIGLDAAGNMYVAQQYNHRIIKITPSLVVTTIAGSGSSGSNDAPGTAASFNNPTGIALDADGNIYVADQYNNKIRKINSNYYSISPALPAGLTFNNTTGEISGTPTTASGPTTYTVSAANEGGSATATVSITTELVSGLSKNGAITTNPVNFINRNGAKGSVKSVNKNGKAVN